MSIRKILIPVAAGLLFGPALMAADLATPTENDFWSKELLNLAGSVDVVLAGNIGVVLGAEYAIQDKVTLTFTGSALDESTLTTSVIVPCVAEGVMGDGDGFAGMTWGLLNSSADHGTWRLTEIDTTTCTGATSTVGATVNFAAANTAEFSAPAVNASNGVSATFSAETSTGDPIDTAGGADRTATLFTVQNEIAYSVSGFSGVVDVNTDRTTLIPGPDDDASYSVDALVLPADCCVDVNTVATDNSEVIWAGDFSWIIDDDEVTPGIQPQTGVVTMDNCDALTIVVTATTISNDECFFTGSDMVLDPSSNLDIDDDPVTLSATIYTVSIAANYDDDGEWEPCCGNTGSSNFDGISAGAWTLNGYQAFIPYMPYGAGITQVIYLANRGTTVGDITVEWIDKDATSGTLGVIGSLGAGTTLAIGPIIQAALPAAQKANGRLALTVTVNVPASDVQMNSQYNVNGNRAFTLHEDNRD